MDLQIKMHDTHGVITLDISNFSVEELNDRFAERPDLDWIIDSSAHAVTETESLSVLKEIKVPGDRLVIVAVIAANEDIEDALDASLFTWAPTANEAFDLLAMAQIERELGL